jgi:hypothetical protein
MKRATLAATAALLLLASVASAETVKFAKGGIQFDLPEGWTTVDRDGGDLGVVSPDDTVKFLFTLADKVDMDVFQVKVSDTLAEHGFGTWQGGEDPDEIEVNGLKTLRWRGTAAREGEELAWVAFLFEGKKPVFALCAALPKDMETHMDQAEALVESVSKAP